MVDCAKHILWQKLSQPKYHEGAVGRNPCILAQVLHLIWPSRLLRMQGSSSVAIRLYKLHSMNDWELIAADASPRFYDVNASHQSSKPLWFLATNKIIVEVHGHCSFEDSSKRAIMLGYRDTWALQFPSQQAFDSFVTEYKEKLAENTRELGGPDAQEDAQQIMTTPETQTEMKEDSGQPDEPVNDQAPDMPTGVSLTSLKNSWVLIQS